MLLTTILNALTLSGLLYVIAVGLNLSFGLMRIVNLTHGGFYLLGGYLGLALYKLTGSWLLGLLSGGILVGVLAFAEHRFLLKLVRGKPLLETLLSLAIAIVISDLVIVVFGGHPKLMRVPEALDRILVIFGSRYSAYRLFALGIAAAVGGGLHLFLRKTRVGMIIRAGVDDYEMVSAVGINVRRIFTLVFILSGFLAGFAGVIGGTFLMVAPGEDWRMLTFALIVIIIGGIGSLNGTAVGALITGFTYTLGSLYFPQLSLFLLFMPVALILAIRPQGLFGRAER